MNALDVHLSHLTQNSPEFQYSLAALPTGRRRRYLRLLERLDIARNYIAPNGRLHLLHDELSRMAAAAFAESKELNFCAPPPDVWIALAVDRTRRTNLLDRWWTRLKELLRRHGGDGWGLYGGLKPKASVLSKLASHHNGCEPLDLWDLVRFRLVVPDLVTLQYASQRCVSELSELVRYRNYYLRPRMGWRDPYRAIHFEYADGDDYIELQVLTERRDAVGLVDHALVRKKSLCYQSPCHRDWLTSISYAANIEDASEMLRSHHTTVATTHQKRLHR